MRLVRRYRDVVRGFKVTKELAVHDFYQRVFTGGQRFVDRTDPQDEQRFRGVNRVAVLVRKTKLWFGVDDRLIEVNGAKLKLLELRGCSIQKHLPIEHSLDSCGLEDKREELGIQDRIIVPHIRII